MNAPTSRRMFLSEASSTLLARSDLASRLRRHTGGQVLFDAFSRGRYSTDASFYQVEPVGVLVPRTEADVVAAIDIARDMKVPVLPRGAGTSQCGQTVGEALVVDVSRHLNQVLQFDRDAMTVTVQPGIVLDHLNAWLKPHGLWFPVDVSTSAQCTIGGMAGNNSCGSRSLEYGNMVHNVAGIDAILSDGTQAYFGTFGDGGDMTLGNRRLSELVPALFSIARRERDEIERVWPKVLRRVGGYNLDIFHPQSVRPYTPDGSLNLSHLLVGSEGTLAFTRRIKLKLAPLPTAKTLGVVSFPTFHAAMDSAQHIVKLGPVAVELVDRTMIELSRANPSFAPVIERALTKVDGKTPDAILLVEFTGDDHAQQVAKLSRLDELMSDLGLPDSVVKMTDAGAQKALWEVRKAGLNIMMSMKGDGKPVSFIEDCAVPLEHLAEYTDRLTEVFARHGTKGTWYAHASVGTLHVRPILDMRVAGEQGGAAKMRAIAEEAGALVRQFKGAFSGEHGDGLVRSEWVQWQFGDRLTKAFEEIKDLFDPAGLMNPGKIVRCTKMDDASLFRFKPGHAALPLRTALDWSAWNVSNLLPGQDPEATSPPGTGGDATGGFAKAAEMCNNNGHCRKFDAGTMCPSYRATGDEQHLTRGRANTLRLALTGQLGPDALTSEGVHEALDLCVACKGCKRECPTGVDMARMKTEFLYHWRKKHGIKAKDWLVANLPRYAPAAARIAPLLNLRDRLPLLARLTERWLDLSAKRTLPRWRADGFLRRLDRSRKPLGTREVVLLVDTFNNHFDSENARAALRVLEAAGYAVHVAGADDPGRPLCCGRTYLAAGLVEQARAEASRTLAALLPYAERGVPIVGLEPSCLLTLRDEFLALKLDQAAGRPGAARKLADAALLFEEFLAREQVAGRLALELAPLPQKKALLHGHCHQKAFDAVKPIQTVLGLIPGLKVELIESSCCGMAGAFGYEARHHEVSMKMAELSLLPAVRAAGDDVLIVADGTSCRHQIHDGAGRDAVHVARVLAAALAS